MTRVKVCGIMNQKDLDLCVQAGVDMVGFVAEYPRQVPWNLSAEEARELIRRVPPFVGACLVTGGPVEKIMDLVHKTCPNVVQLHYQETMREVKELAHRLMLRGIKTIKALRINDLGKCDGEFSDPVLAARELFKTGVSAILVDSYTPARPGGTGVAVDLPTFLMIQKESPAPVILAGGLNPANILPIIYKTRPYAVDVLTGVEERPGRKDPEKVRGFMSNVRGSVRGTGLLTTFPAFSSRS